MIEIKVIVIASQNIACTERLSFRYVWDKKREFWMPFHLYAETRPSLNINSINGIGTSFSAGMSSAVGLRVKL